MFLQPKEWISTHFGNGHKFLTICDLLLEIMHELLTTSCTYHSNALHIYLQTCQITLETIHKTRDTQKLGVTASVTVRMKKIRKQVTELVLKT